MSQSKDPPLHDGFAEWCERQAEVGPYNALYDRPAVLELLGDVEGTGSSTSDAARASTRRSS